jgi:hypothetical protein
MSVNAHAKRAYKTDNRTLDADRRETEWRRPYGFAALTI